MKALRGYILRMAFAVVAVAALAASSTAGQASSGSHEHHSSGQRSAHSTSSLGIASPVRNAGPALIRHQHGERHEEIWGRPTTSRADCPTSLAPEHCELCLDQHAVDVSVPRHRRFVWITGMARALFVAGRKMDAHEDVPVNAHTERLPGLEPIPTGSRPVALAHRFRI